MKMHKNEIIFVTMFVIVISGLLFMFGISITANVVSNSMYCNQGECMPTCRTDADCLNSGYICCSKQNYGVCKISELCDEPYNIEFEELKIKNTFTSTILPDLENPSKITKINPIIYGALIILVSGIGLFYLLLYKK
jgi:hypothetical protein